jgi:hypothetical protein
LIQDDSPGFDVRLDLEPAACRRGGLCWGRHGVSPCLLLPALCVLVSLLMHPPCHLPREHSKNAWHGSQRGMPPTSRRSARWHTGASPCRRCQDDYSDRITVMRPPPSPNRSKKNAR